MKCQSEEVYGGGKRQKSKIPRRPLLKAMTFTISQNIEENEEKYSQNSGEDDNEGEVLLKERPSESESQY